MHKFKFLIQGSNYHALAQVYFLPFVISFFWIFLHIKNNYKNVNSNMLFFNVGSLAVLGTLNCLRIIFDFTAMFYLDGAITVYSPVTYYFMLQVF